MAILNRFSAILLYCDSSHLFASRCGISGDSRLRDSRFCAVKVREENPLLNRIGGSLEGT